MRPAPSGTMRAPWLNATVMMTMLAALVGCAGADDGDPDDQVPEETESEAQAIKNASVSGTKICVRVTNDTTLFRDPDGTATVTTTSKNGASIEADARDPRYVLVQPKPGRVGLRVWADPDLNGLRSDADIPALAKRCRISVNAARRAAAKVVADKYTRRGWVEVGDLSGDLFANLEANAPNGSSGATTPGQLRTVIAQCLPQGEYVGGSKSDPAGFYTYGTCTHWKVEAGSTKATCASWGKELYLSYGTPEIDGGGLSFGYLAAGQVVHELGSHVHEQVGDHCQTDDRGGKILCNGDAPSSDRARRIFWSEIYAKVGGRTVKGWLPTDCLK